MKTRRASALFAVMVVVAITSVIGAATLFTAGAQRDAALAPLRRDQSRALAWSGVQALMAELSAQRLSLLDAEEPTITSEWTLFEENGVRGLFRHVATAQAAGSTIVSEAAKLDINVATPEMLGALELLGPELATAIVQRRTSAPFTSVDELLSVSGVTPELLYGDAIGSAGDSSVSDEPTRLIDVLTVHSADPNIQFGFGPRGANHRGKLRISLNREWTDEMGEAIADRFDASTANGVRSVMTQPSALSPDGNALAFDSESDIVAVLRRLAGVSSPRYEDWYEIMDSFTGRSEEFVRGRIDINLAPAAVLACVPGIDREAANRIVSTRSSVDAERRRSVVWIADEEILTAAQFEQAVDWLTARSMQWRVRIEAGVQRVDEFDLGDRPTGSGGGRIGGLDSMEEPPLEGRIVLEAIVDLASERARVAYLRDVTLLDFAAARIAAAEEASVNSDDAPLTNEPPEDGPTPRASNFSRGSGGLNTSRLDPAERGLDGSEGFGNEPDHSGGEDGGMDVGLDAPRTDAGASNPPADARIGRWTSHGVRP